MEVSILITNFNYGKYLERCIRSCLNQNFLSNYEVLIVDDNSKDNSHYILNKYRNNEKVKIIKNKKNMGIGYCSNLGLDNSQGRFFIRVDADDYINENLLFILSEFLKNNPEYLCVSCDYFSVNEKNEKLLRISAATNPISCGIMYRRDNLINLGGYNDKYRHREEEELRARLGHNYKIFHLPFPLYRYWKHNKNKTRQKNYKKYQLKIKSISNLNSSLIKKHKIIAIIPAKLNSQRLKNKNIRKVNGKFLIEYVMNALKKSNYIDKIYLTSESKKLLKIAKSNNISQIQREKKLSEPDVHKVIPVIDALNQIEKKLKMQFDIVVIPQANSPELDQKTIDSAISKLINENLNEVITINPDGNQNAALRVIKRDILLENKISTHIGTITKDLIDIHNLDDLIKFKQNNLKNKI